MPSRELTTSTRTVTTAQGVTVPEHVVERARKIFEKATSSNTKRAYSTQWRMFGEWCTANGYEPTVGVPVPAEVVVLYLGHLSTTGAKLATVRARVASIAKWHKSQGLPSPTETETVRRAVNGYEAELAEKAKEEGAVHVLPEPSSALMRKELLSILATIDTTTTKGLRDRALFLLGWAGAFRASELVGLRVEHLQKHQAGLVVTAYATKTGKNVAKEVEYEESPELCPVRALGAWLERAEITEGPVFRSVTKGGKVGESMTTRALGGLMKHYASEAELREGKWSWHSLRAGYATQHILDRVPEAYVRKQGGWANSSPVFLGYVERAEAFSVRRATVGK